MKINNNPTLASLVSSLYDSQRNAQNATDPAVKEARLQRLQAEAQRSQQSDAQRQAAEFQSLELKQAKKPPINSFAREVPAAGAAKPQNIQPGQHLNILV